MATTGANPSGTTPQTTITRSQWISEFLKAGGWPNTQQNVQAVLTWIMGEGTGAAANPLATTLSSPGATNYNSSGVKNYSSYQQGITASVDTIKNTPAYAGIDKALASGGSSANVLKAIQSTHSWTGFGGTLQSLMGELSSTVTDFSNLIDQGVPAPGEPNGMASGAATPTNFGIPSVSSIIGPASTLLTDLTSGSWWKTIGTYTLGAGLVILGIVLFTGSQKLNTVANTVAK